LLKTCFVYFFLLFLEVRSPAILTSTVVHNLSHLEYSCSTVFKVDVYCGPPFEFPRRFKHLFPLRENSPRFLSPRPCFSPSDCFATHVGKRSSFFSLLPLGSVFPPFFQSKEPSLVNCPCTFPATLPPRVVQRCHRPVVVFLQSPAVSSPSFRIEDSRTQEHFLSLNLPSPSRRENSE